MSKPMNAMQTDAIAVQQEMHGSAAADNECFVFPRGIAGFPEARHFGFIYEGRGDIVCMQCVELPEAAFLLAQWDVARLGEAPSLTAEERRCLKLEEGRQPMWMLVLNPFADTHWVTANLKAPIALNPELRLGLQCIRAEAELPLRYRWMPQPGKAE